MKNSVYLMVVVVLLGFLFMAGCTTQTPQSIPSTQSQASSEEPTAPPAPTNTVSTPAPINTVSTPTPTKTVSTPAPTLKQDATTMGESNAAKKALDYLKYSSFSQKGLIEQLEYEGFTRQQAEYGVSQSGANWNEQAALKAKSYLKYSSFSRNGLIDQLEYEGFTPRQAEYGVQAVGY